MAKPIVKELKTFLDERGYLYEIVRSDDSYYTKFGQMYISSINPQVIKGFHIHYNKTDMMACIQGQVKLVLIDSSDSSLVYEYNLSPMCPKLIVVPPGLWHGWMCIGTEKAILVNITTEPFDPNFPDEDRVHPINNPWNYKWEIKNG